MRRSRSACFAWIPALVPVLKKRSRPLCQNPLIATARSVTYTVTGGNPPDTRLHPTAAELSMSGRIKPRLAVYSHAPNAESVMTHTRKTYTGPLQAPDDMLTIEIGEKIDVRHFAR